MGTSRRGDDNVGKPRSKTFAASQVGQLSSYTRGGNIKSEDSVAIEMQYGIKPSRQISRFTPSPLSASFSNSIFDLSYGYNRQIKLGRVLIHPFRQFGQSAPLSSARRPK